VSIKNDGHYFCRAGGNRPDGLNEPVTSEQYYHEYIRQQKSISGGHGASYAPVQDNEWTPPSPGM
ncbi:hypothetical protein, partial [Escherichia coli]|uniref:hypothetical protein n=1 Tax=Escherichia coli TaxID=562 RepID=UPI0011357EC8